MVHRYVSLHLILSCENDTHREWRAEKALVLIEHRHPALVAFLGDVGMLCY